MMCNFRYRYNLALCSTIIGVGTLAASFPLVLPVSAALCATLLFAILLACVRSDIPRDWLAIILSLKALYAADIALAIFDGRPLRYAPEIGSDAAQLRGQALLMLLLWTASFIATASAFSGRYLRMQISQVANENRTWIGIVSTGLVALSQIGFIVITIEVGGAAKMLASMSNRHEVYFGIGFLRVVVGAGAIGAALLFLCGRKKLSWFLATIIFCELALLGGRSYALFSTIIPICMLWISGSKRIPVGRVLLMAALALAFVSALGSYRSAQLSAQYHASAGVLSRLVMDTGAADNFPSLLSLLRRDVVPFSGNEIVASAVLAPVPRAVWKEKPVTDEAATIGVLLANTDRVNWGLPIGPHGLAYFTGGAILIPIFGVISGLFFAYVMTRSGHSVAWAAGAPFLLLLSPDILSPSTTARVFVLTTLIIVISLTLRFRFPR
ncbi:hypothetical protein ABE493_09145 [Stenotrophomonas terrae]|uniref:hypothetical protein n=1 Tax=Stenotrophomonas terrae TaxID=405446 RepID=UPI00320901AC